MARRQHPMEAGERDKQITLQQLTESKGGSSFPVETWTTLTTVYASRMDVGGSERFAAGQQTSPYTTRWEIPYRADMDPDLLDVPKKRRVVYQGRFHDITAASMIGRNEGVELLTIAAKVQA